MTRSTAESFLQRVSRTIDRHAMLASGDRVLVAVSGGPDSTALLAALQGLRRRYSTSLCIAHFDHRLRGNESQRDALWVGALAENLGLPAVFGQSESRLQGSNLESRARVQRYAFLERAAAAQGCKRIATGHTADDQAETVLMRLVRGAGGDGLAGIPATRGGQLIRPLLECSRSHVMTFLQACHLRFCDDTSNSDRRFLRNRIRHEVMPLLRSLNPRVEERLAAAASILAEESEWLEDMARTALGQISAADELRVSGLLSCPPALQPRVIRAWLESCRGHLENLEAAHVHAILAQMRGPRPNTRVILPSGGEVIREYDRLRFAIEPLPTEGSEWQALLTPGGSVRLQSGWQIQAEILGLEAIGPLPHDLSTLVADAAEVTEPLTVRALRRGDRVRPLGLGGHRKLQDVFVDHKLPLGARRACPVVEADGEILWVPGVVRSAHALITDRTRHVLRLRAEQTGIAGL